jgi:mono/diheme cytochrome c family protein
MKKNLILISSLVLFVVGIAVGRAQENKSAKPFKIPTEDAQRQNPVKATPATLAEGKRMYGLDCVYCHGKAGDGKGELVESMSLKLHDWRDPESLKGFTDGELFYIITKGKGDMPAEEGRRKPEECWQVINYIRSFARKGAAASSETAEKSKEEAKDEKAKDEKAKSEKPKDEKPQ